MSNTPKWSGYFEIVPPAPKTADITDNQDLSGGSLYSNNSWYQRIIQGSSSRINKYKEYDAMDDDVEVARALDTIAEEMTSFDLATRSPILIDFQLDDDRVKPYVIETLRSALRVWCDINQLDDQLFDIVRVTIKYGDCFFVKGKTGEGWSYIHPRHVLAASVNENNVTDVRGWLVDLNFKQVGNLASSSYMPAKNQIEAVPLESSKIVRFTRCSQTSDSAPFGESVLRPVYKAFKQKELLEDAIIIYRITRAPERRVFYVDVGKMPPARVKAYLENVKNELKQKKIPTVNNNTGMSQVESVYNPQSMTEDFFFAQQPNGKGSRVEVLPGGQGLGELRDLEYFQEKVFRGLRIPTSYMPMHAGDNPVFNDGKMGQSYVEELRFALYVGRLQKSIEVTLDQEFKKFLTEMNINCDPSLFKLRLPEAQNFGKYRQQELDAALLNAFSASEGINALSKRFTMKRYLQLSDSELATNERLKAEEMGVDRNDPELIKKIYGEPEMGEGGGGADMGMGGAGGLGDLGTGGDFGMDMASSDLEGGPEGMDGGPGGDMGAEGGPEGGADAPPPPPPGQQ